MTSTELRAWRERLGLSQTEAARALGVTPRGYQRREAGEVPIGRETALACAAIEAGIEAA